MCFVLQKVGSRMGDSVTMSTLYPKRTFSERDMSTTLLDLQLAPSAVILVTPVRLIVHHGGGIRSTVVVRWTAGSLVGQSILHQGHDS